MNSNEKIKRALDMIRDRGGDSPISIISGFVSKTYSKGEDGYGTIDFISYNNLHINGVKLTGLDDNSRGDISVPMVNSEVIIISLNGRDFYVFKDTWVDEKNIEVNKNITIGVTGLEDFNDDDDKDFDDLSNNGLSSLDNFSETQVIRSVTDQSDENNVESSNITSTKNSITQSIISGGDTQSEISHTSDNVEISKGDSTSVNVGDNVTIKSQTTQISNGGTVEPAVLGNALSTVLNNFIDEVAKITTATAIGTQPILNIAQVIALKSTVSSIISKTLNIE